MADCVMNKIVDNWEIIPSGCTASGMFIPENWDEVGLEEYPLIIKEQRVIHDMLKLFIPGEYGYYFSVAHEHDKPEDIPKSESVWKTVYDTPLAFYYKAGEYNTITTASTEDYVYYAISLHGSSLASALTEFVKRDRY